VNLGELLFWEALWFHEVFRPMRNGIASFPREEALECPRPPRLPKTTAYEELNVERLREWRKKDEAHWAELRKGRIVEMRLRWTRSVPDEKHIWNALKLAATPEEVRTAYTMSKYWFNPKWHGRAYVNQVYEHADLVVKAKNDPRYPRSDRPSSDDKRLEFFPAVMAGITEERSPLTAVDLLRKHKHSDACYCRRCCNSRY